jgi:hypothetical protein
MKFARISDLLNKRGVINKLWLFLLEDLVTMGGG